MNARLPGTSARSRARRAWAGLALLLVTLTPVGLLPAPPATAAGCVAGSTSTVQIDTAQPILGAVLEFSGTGWCHPTDGGSRIAVKLDLGAFSRPDTSVHTNKTIWAIVDADPADGSFTASFRLPGGTAATSTPAFAAGEHSLQLLTGSLKTGDSIRSVTSAPFTAIAPGDPVPPTWSHATVTAGGATAWVEDESPAGDGGSIRIAGTGWTKTAGGASSIAVKLNAGPDGEQYERTGAAVVHDDPTIWAMLAVADDGTLDTAVDLPDGLVAGQYLSVSLLTGKFANGDAQRAATTRPLVVGGMPWEGDDDDPEAGPCTPTSAAPTVHLASTSASFGGTLHVEGTGWCHPSSGGSRIAMKIDDGAYSHLSSSLSSNRTIWAIVDANDSNGTFSADVTLPDGTASTSDPVLPRGEHTLRLLTGSLIAGDTPRTLESEPFVVGRYRPNGAPDPLDAARQLRSTTRHGVRATVGADHLTVVVPQSAARTWAFVSLYAADGSPRFPWSRWWRINAAHRIDLPLGNRDGVVGRLRIVVQNGDPGRVGDLLGWTTVRFGSSSGTPAVTPAPSTSPSPSPPGSTAISPPPTSPLAAVPPPALSPPAPPVASYADLDPDEHGSVSAVTDAGVVTLTARRATPGDSVFLYVYAPEQLVPTGWATVDDERRIRVDLSAFDGGYAAITVQDGQGRMLGWAPVSLGPTTADPAPTRTAAEPPTHLAPVSADTGRVWIGTTDGLLLALGALVLAATSFGLGLRRPGATA